MRFIILFFIPIITFSQSLQDSVKVTFRNYEQQGNNLFVPGEFNGWGPNSSGTISIGATSQMSWDSELSCFVKTYNFKLKDPSDTRRRIADTVFQYKFNKGGSSSGWYSDPLNSETNPSDNSNSVLRLTKLKWFEVYKQIANDKIFKFSASLIQLLNDTVSAIKFYTGPTSYNIVSVLDITSSFNSEKKVLNYSLASPINSGDYLKIVAIMNSKDSAVYESGGVLINYRAMPTYAKHGVTLPSTQSNDSTTFRIRVGGKKFVNLKITTSGSDFTTAKVYLMNKDLTTDNWWINLKLAEGNYDYAYEFDDGIQVPDPFGRSYNGNVSKFSTTANGLAADDYIWKNKNFIRPELNKIIIYEMQVSEFAGSYFGKPSGQGTFQDLIKLLPYFDSLGVNALELMPITDYGSLGKSGFSWGYDNASHFAIEPAFGNARDFKMLVDSAHSHGIAIILDVVYNHLNGTAALWRMQPDAIANPYFKLKTDFRYNEDALFFFEDLDHWSDETQEMVYLAQKMWIDEFKVDGFRYDFTQGIGWNINEPSKGILGWTNKIADEYNNSIYQILEHLPESPALVKYSGATSNWHDSFRDKIFDERFGITSLSDFENLIIGLGAFRGNDTPSEPSSYSSRSEAVNATVTHDETSMIYEMTKGISYAEALKRDKLYSTFMFTSLGIPMLWQSMELGTPRGFTESTKLNYRPVDWSYYNTSEGKEHFNYFARLAHQRRRNPALFRGNLKYLNRYENLKSLVWGFEDTLTNAKVMVIANLSSMDQTLTNLNWLSTGTWYDVFSQNKLEITNTTVPTFSVGAFKVFVFSNKSNSDLGIITSIKNENKLIPTKFKLNQNFPNPFNPTTTISYDLPTEEIVNITIYDIYGREVKVLEKGRKEAGTHFTIFNGADLSSGIYFCKFKTGSYFKTIKLNLLK